MTTIKANSGKLRHCWILDLDTHLMRDLTILMSTRGGIECYDPERKPI